MGEEEGWRAVTCGVGMEQCSPQGLVVSWQQPKYRMWNQFYTAVNLNNIKPRNVTLRGFCAPTEHVYKNVMLFYLGMQSSRPVVCYRCNDVCLTKWRPDKCAWAFLCVCCPLSPRQLLPDDPQQRAVTGHRRHAQTVYAWVWWPLFCLVEILSQALEAPHGRTRWRPLTRTAGDGRTDVCAADVNDDRRSCVATARDPRSGDVCADTRV